MDLDVNMVKELCNYSFAALISVYLLVRLDKRLERLSDSIMALVREIRERD